MAPFTPDISVAEMQEAGLCSRVSVRNGAIIVQYIRDGKGVEVAYSARAATQFAEHILKAVGVAEGRG